MDPIVIAIEDLQNTKIPALKKRYRELFGEESKSSNKQFLFRRIAWRLQANAEGDLSERARLRAAEIADDRDLRIRAPKEFVAGPEHSVRNRQSQAPPKGLKIAGSGHAAHPTVGRPADRGEGPQRWF